MPPDDADRLGIDIALMLNNNEVGFTQSARRHRVARARVLSVLALHGYVEIEQSGRLLEVIAVFEDTHLVVIHAMDAQPKLIRLYKERARRGTQ